MTIVIIFLIGFFAGRLAQARAYSKMALPASAPVVELPEPEIETAAPVVVVKSPAVEKPTMPAQEPQETASTDAEPLTDKEQARRRREAERAAIAQQKCEQAQIDYDHYTMQRDRLMELADVVENELTGNITEKRRAALMRQRITLEERLYQTEKRMNKAYFTIHNAA